MCNGYVPPSGDIAIRALYNSFLFSCLSGEEDRDSLVRMTRLRDISRNEIIAHQGECPDGMFMVLSGEVKLLMASPSGSERIVRLVRSGDTFCEEVIFSDMPLRLSAQANHDSLILFIPRHYVLSSISTQPSFSEAFMRLLTKRMNDLLSGMELCEQRNNAQRVAHYLVNHACKSQDAIEVRLSSAKQVIASQLNMTPESFSRVLSRLTRDGFILPRGRHAITLKDFSALENLAA